MESTVRTLPQTPPHNVAGRVYIDDSLDFRDTRTNWAIAILPYLEGQALYDLYNQNVWNSHPDNLPVLETFLKVQTCPSDVDSDTRYEPRPRGTDDGISTPIATGSYKGVEGVRVPGQGGVFWDRVGIGLANLRANLWARGPLHITGVGGFEAEKFATITDGTSNTLLIGEYHTVTVPGNKAFWASSHREHNSGMPQRESYARIADYEACDAVGPFGNCLCALASMHPGVINFVMCDGSVRPISDDIDGEVYTAMGTIDAGDLVELP